MVAEELDYRKLTSAEAQQLLIEAGHSEDSISDLSRWDKIKLLRGKQDEGVPNLDRLNLEVEEEKMGDNEESNGVEDVNPTDPGWTEWVMKQLTKDEFYNGHPKTEGLRRISEVLLGDIVSSVSDVKQTPDLMNERRATVVHTITFATERTFSGAADVYWGNTDKPFRNHPVATAETKAEGRALKRALKLKNVVTAEEIASEVADHGEADAAAYAAQAEGMFIHPQQIKLLEIMCGNTGRGLNINVEKFVEETLKKKYNTIKEVSKIEALELVKKASEYQQDASSIPGELKGYDSNWLVTFGK